MGGTTERRFTEPQRKALLWLTPGQSCGDAPRSVSAALNSLKLYHGDLVTAGWATTPRGRTYLAFTLTEMGVAARALLAQSQAPQSPGARGVRGGEVRG